METTSLQQLPLFRGLVNSDNGVCSRKINVHAQCMEGVSSNFATTFPDMENLIPTSALFLNPFVVDVVKDGCPAHKTIV